MNKEASTLEIIQKTRYDEKLAFKHYKAFMEHRKRYRLYQAYIRTLPLIRKMYVRVYRDRPISELSADEIQSYASVSLWSYLKSRKFNPETHRNYTTMVRKIIYFSMKAGWRFLGEGQGIPEGYDYKHPGNKFATYWHVENKILIEELPKVVANLAKRSSRINGKHDRLVSYLINRVAKGKRPIPHYIKSEFGIKDYKFLYDYVRFLCRKTLYHLREKCDTEFFDSGPVQYVFDDRRSTNPCFSYEED